METVVDFAAGCIGGCAGLFVGHPFDTVKVRLQLQRTETAQYRGTVHCFKSIIQKESIRGLYKGITSPLYSVAFINAIVFGVQGDLQRRLSNPGSILSYTISGAAAGFVQCFVCSPMELAKIRMQMQGIGQQHSQGNNYRGTLDCLTKIYNMEGWRGVYKGMYFTLLREVPSFSIYFAAYEYFCRRLTSGKDKNAQTPTWALLVSGGSAGCLSWLFLNPVDVIKSRMQMDGMYKNGMISYEYKGYADCIAKSVAKDGYRVLFQGLSSAMLRAFPTNAATLTTVTWVLRLTNSKETANERLHTMERSGIVAHME